MEKRMQLKKRKHSSKFSKSCYGILSHESIEEKPYTLDSINDYVPSAIMQDFDYQEELTNKLDDYSEDFTHDTINEIVLWKVNRYPIVSKEALRILNTIGHDETEICVDKTRCVLASLLTCKGIRLPMASTLLRFKNPVSYTHLTLPTICSV